MSTQAPTPAPPSQQKSDEPHPTAHGRVDLRLLLEILGGAAIIAGFGVWCGMMQASVNELQRSVDAQAAAISEHTSSLGARIATVEQKLANLPADSKLAIQAFDSIVVQRDAFTEILVDRAATLIDQILMASPTHAQAKRIRELQILAVRCKQLYEKTDTPVPRIYDLINDLDSVSTYSAKEGGGRKAREDLERITRSDGYRVYALARILLARFGVAETPAHSTSDDEVRTMDLVRQSLDAYEYSATAWNIATIGALFHGFRTLDAEHDSSAFASLFAEQWPNLAKVRQYDESATGQFRYLNNSAFMLALAMVKASSSQECGPAVLEWATFEKATNITACMAVSLLVDHTKRSIDLDVDREGALRTAAQTYAALGVFSQAHADRLGKCAEPDAPPSGSSERYLAKSIDYYKAAMAAMPSKYTLTFRLQDMKRDDLLRCLPERSRQVLTQP